jgi:hypothetical protein
VPDLAGLEGTLIRLKRKEFVKRKRALIIGMLLILGVCGCWGPLVRTDLDSLRKNPDEFKGKAVLLTTDIASLLDNQESYLHHKVELTGQVEYLGFPGQVYWSFLLKDEAGRALHCYEQEYHVYSWGMVDAAIRRAEREHGVVTVVGKPERGGRLELDWIDYRGQHLDTDHKPPSFHVPLLR